MPMNNSWVIINVTYKIPYVLWVLEFGQGASAQHDSALKCLRFKVIYTVKLTCRLKRIPG